MRVMADLIRHLLLFEDSDEQTELDPALEHWER